MHIKEIEFQNFKSFGKKTRIPFYRDFTVITGPNGSGKCLSYDMEVHLSDGERRKIGEIVEESLKKHSLKYLDGVIAFPENLEIISMDEKMRVVERPVSAVMKRPSPEFMIEVVLSSGRTLVVTPSHPFFLWKGEVILRSAVDLSPGEKLLTVSEFQISSEIGYEEIASVKKIPPPSPFVYDLCIEKLHNFVANGTVVHNSNIIDGIVFALGLSGSRALRAEKLTDLLHAEKNGKKANSMHVKIVLDNSDRALPVESDEVTIMRRVKETEANYYSYFYLNGKPVTLSELHELLSDAGISSEAYNVVLQGDVTRITLMTPVERRKIIDEIAGIAEFDEKKEQAKEQLNVVRERIEQMEILIKEDEIRLKELEKDREVALKYLSLRDEKKRYESMISAVKLKEYREELERVEKEIERLQREKDALSGELSELSRKLREVEDEISKLNSEIDQIAVDERIRLNREIENLRSSNELSERIIKEAEKRIDEEKSRIWNLRKEMEDIEDRKVSLLQEIEVLEERRKSLEDRKLNLESKLGVLRMQISELEEQYSDIAPRYEALREKLNELKDLKNDLLRERDRLYDNLRSRSEEIERKKKRISEIGQKILELSSKEEEIEKEEEIARKLIEENLKEIKKAEERVSKILKELEEIDSKFRALEREKSSIEAKIKAVRELSGYSPAVERVLRWRDEKVLPGIYGVIAELGRVKSEYAKALEVAAGQRMQYIVVATDEDAARAIEMLKRERVGRATFLPLNVIRDSPPKLRKPDVEGAIDYAINLISYDKKFEPAFWYVFRDTLVMRDLDSARKHIGKWRMVTLDGELIEIGGAITGGYTPKSRFSFLDEDEERLAVIEEELEELEGMLKVKKMEYANSENELRALREALYSYEKKIDDIPKKFEELAEERKRFETERSEIEAEIRKSEEEIRSLVARVGEIDEKVREIDSQLLTSQKELEKFEKIIKSSRIPELKKEEENLKAEIEDVKEQIRQSESRMKEARVELDYLEKRSSELKKEMENCEKRIKESEELIEREREEMSNREGLLKAFEERLSEIEEKVGALRRERDARIELMRRMEIEKSAVSSEIERADERIRRMELRREELRDYIKSLETEEIPEIEEELSYEELMKRIEEIDKALDDFGVVNMKAPEEYDEVRRRLEDKRKKCDTLYNEMNEILKRIEKYEAMKKQTFMEAFNAINSHFKEIFHELSEGEGELVLENPEDPFKGGLIIKARPKAKTISKLTAMSGGEKSLTALSFIFAIQRYKPAPFYVLDEIDMFLDGANVEKVARMIKRLSKDAQFIVVSLRRPMIESANRVVGVVMQEDGNSTITGVKLN
ncbi:MAG: chromosome segregation protein [Archaeoglobi archaeon]|nr:chromosome segregation protein [Archaeoglobi archaeon]